MDELLSYLEYGAVLVKAVEGMDKTMEGLDKSNAAPAKVLEKL